MPHSTFYLLRSTFPRPLRVLAPALLWALTVTLSPSGATRLPSSAERAADAVTADVLHAYVQRLASDEMAGRGIGQEGNRSAEMFVAEALQRSGAVPAVNGSYFHPVQVYEPRLGAGSRLEASASGAPIAELIPGADFYPLPSSGNVPVTARLVFAGHGISAPALHHDDYAHVDVRGAIAVVLEGTPSRLSYAAALGDEPGSVGSAEAKVANAAAHGAAGILVIQGYLGELRDVWPEHAGARAASYRLYSAFQRARLPAAAISESAAEPLRRAMDRGPVTATLVPDLVAQPLTIDNVIGCVEGRDPSRREMVVVGAHLDHDGTDEDGQIFNGADDNASGTAAVLAIASAFARAAAQGERPRRSVVFALWNGEEKGSLGAEAYVAAPQPPRRIVANINLDMIGRDEDVPDPDDVRYRGLPRTSAAENRNVVHLLGYSYAPDLAQIVVSANDAVRLTIKQDYDRNAQNLVRRSDDWPFLARGIPAVFLTTGLHPDYHTPADDTDRINFSKLERITRLAFRAAWLAAEGRAPRFRKLHG